MLGLSPTELKRVKALLTERALSGRDAYVASLKQKRNRDEALRDKASIQEAVDKEISNVVSGEKLTTLMKLADCEKYLDEVGTTFNADLAFDGVPLDTKQSLYFAQQLKAESDNKTKSAARPSVSDPRVSERDAAVLAALSGIVSERQIEVIRTTMQTNFKNTAVVQKFLQAKKK